MNEPPPAPRTSSSKGSTYVHLLVLLLCLVVLIAGGIATTDSEQIFLDGESLPSLCSWRWISPAGCPGCGLTRSVVSALKLDWRESFRLHPGGLLVLALVFSEIPYRLARLQGWASESFARKAGWFERIVFLVVLGSGLASWIARIIAD